MSWSVPTVFKNSSKPFCMHLASVRSFWWMSMYLYIIQCTVLLHSIGSLLIDESKNACCLDLLVSGHGAGQDEEAAHLPGLLLQRRVREYFRSGKFPPFFKCFPPWLLFSLFPQKYFLRYLIFLECHSTQNKFETLYTFFRGVDGVYNDYLLFLKSTNLHSCFILNWRNPRQVLNTKKGPRSSQNQAAGTRFNFHQSQRSYMTLPWF
jgi:hypothetical protein